MVPSPRVAHLAVVSLTFASLVIEAGARPLRVDAPVQSVWSPAVLRLFAAAETSAGLTGSDTPLPLALGATWNPVAQLQLAGQINAAADSLHVQVGWGSQSTRPAYGLFAVTSLDSKWGAFVGPKLQLSWPLTRGLGGRFSIPIQTEILFPAWNQANFNPWDTQVSVLYETSLFQTQIGMKFGEDSENFIKRTGFFRVAWSPAPLINIELGTLASATPEELQWGFRGAVTFFFGQPESRDPPGARDRTTPVSAHVGRVDSELSLLWIDSGTHAGLVNGQLYLVERAGIPLAQAQVIATKTDAAVLKVIQYFDGTPILPGDLIQTPGL